MRRTLRDKWNQVAIASEDLERENQTEKEVPSGQKSLDWETGPSFLAKRKTNSVPPGHS